MSERGCARRPPYARWPRGGNLLLGGRLLFSPLRRAAIRPQLALVRAGLALDLRAPSLDVVDILHEVRHLTAGKQLAVVERLTSIVAHAAGDPALASRTWVLLTEAPDGGWGLHGHAHTNAELVTAARAQIATLQAGTSADG